MCACVFVCARMEVQGLYTSQGKHKGKWFAAVIVGKEAADNGGLYKLKWDDNDVRLSICCSVLQCVAVCCSVLQRVAVCCSMLQHVAACCSLLTTPMCVCTQLMNQLTKCQQQ